MIFDQPPRQCSGCTHWNYPVSPNGYLEARCQQPKDDRDRKMMRASDYCSKWSKRGASTASDDQMYFG